MRTAAVAIVLSLVLAACGGGGSTTEKDGEGAIYSSPHATWGVGQHQAEIGTTYSAGSVLLCRTGEAVPTLQSIEPVSVRGEVRLDGVHVRTALRPSGSGTAKEQPEDTYLVGLMQGAPTGLRPPQGYVVPNDCGAGPDGDPADDPVGEIVVTMTATGSQGGSMKGLRVHYMVDGDEHVFDIGFRFRLDP